jgi:EAL domain-containing protein (putative c-di-GMP-specific phosphodiesterase class I)/CheY-like chemotaxis protein
MKAKDPSFLPLHILILEDHPFQQMYARELVASLGISHITTARDGSDAFEKIRGNPRPVDIVICDLKMEGMDGIEFIRHVATEKLAKAVILASVLDDDLQRSVEDMARAYGVTVLGRLDKPIARDDLQALIEGYAELSQSRHPRAGADGPPLSVEDIRQALKQRQFVPWFQPRINAQDRVLQGVEALARWLHPEHGTIGPDRFIPLVETHELMNEFTRVIMLQAMEQGRRWQLAGMQVPVSVNFSVTTLQDTDMASIIRNIAVGAGMPPKQVTVEVTETGVADNFAAVLETLTRLRMYGFSLSIDDYGTGYSSMRQLSQIPFTEVKIDRAFISRVDSTPKNRAIVNSTLSLARELNLNTVAEGVETEAELTALKTMGCDLIQGFIIARPMAGELCTEWMQKYNR